MPSARKSENMTLRIDPAVHALLREAAAASGKTLSAFVTEAAVKTAQHSLLDQRFVGVDSTVFDHVAAMLDEPGTANPELVRLFRKNNGWID